MVSRKPNVLITHPDPRDLGGVASFFRILEPFASVNVDHFIIGRRPDETSPHFSIFRLILDYIRFARTLSTGSYDIVHVNPSLNRKGVLRDAVFVLLSTRLFRKKTVVFFHGWEIDYAEALVGWKLTLFNFVFARADATIVLARDFKETLLKWGFEEGRIHVETTAFEEYLTNGFDIERGIQHRRNGYFDVLFFARLVRTKGIYEVLETFRLLGEKFPQMRLVIAGDGPEFANVKAFIAESGLQRVLLTGYIHADEKKDLLTRSAMLFLPSYTEGFPIAVVEAMALGLPVVTRTVGGIKDFFLQGRHGFTTESKDPAVFAPFITRLQEDQELYKDISRANYAHAQEHFSVPEVRRRMEAIYASLQGA
jgi:glycosyltransferase involved in cell wall biosynthesis